MNWVRQRPNLRLPFYIHQRRRTLEKTYQITAFWNECTCIAILRKALGLSEETDTSIILLSYLFPAGPSRHWWIFSSKNHKTWRKNEKNTQVIRMGYRSWLAPSSLATFVVENLGCRNLVRWFGGVRTYIGPRPNTALLLVDPTHEFPLRVWWELQTHRQEYGIDLGKSHMS